MVRCTCVFLFLAYPDPSFSLSLSLSLSFSLPLPLSPSPSLFLSLSLHVLLPLYLHVPPWHVWILLSPAVSWDGSDHQAGSSRPTCPATRLQGRRWKVTSTEERGRVASFIGLLLLFVPAEAGNGEWGNGNQGIGDFEDGKPRSLAMIKSVESA